METLQTMETLQVSKWNQFLEEEISINYKITQCAFVKRRHYRRSINIKDQTVMDPVRVFGKPKNERNLIFRRSTLNQIVCQEYIREIMRQLNVRPGDRKKIGNQAFREDLETLSNSLALIYQMCFIWGTFFRSMEEKSHPFSKKAAQQTEAATEQSISCAVAVGCLKKWYLT